MHEWWNCLVDARSLQVSVVQVAEAVALGRGTFNKIKQNLVWALAYNLVGIPLAAGVLLPAYDIALSPSVAGAMMAFSSVAVVTNSLLLRGGKITSEETSAGQIDNVPRTA